MRARFGALALVALFAVLGPARADHEETEQRLKSAGVDDKLRAEVHKAIARGVAYLIAQQQPDGAFACDVGGHGGEVLPTPGVTLLCALALRHAGTGATVDPVTKAVKWLFEGEDNHLAEIETRVYEAGLALLLLQAEGRHQPEAPRIASGLARALDTGAGWWGYDTPGPAAGDPTAEPPPFEGQTPNLSTTQFAALGLWAARRMKIELPSSVWRRHAESLVAQQNESGSWPYNHPDVLKRLGTVGAGGGKVGTGRGYFTTTCMGFGNLLLAREALKTGPKPPGALVAQLDKAIERSLARLRIDVPEYLEDPGAGELEYIAPRRSTDRGGTPGRGAYYTLFALEKACLFANVESFAVDADAKKPGRGRKGGRLHWYARTAEWLIATQRDDGGWGVSDGKPTNVVDSAFALLILVRSPSAQHPTTPREVDAKPRGAVTPGDPSPPDKPK